MAEYDEEGLFPFSRDRVWKLLTAHLDDATITRIHPLIRSQNTVRRTSDEVVVQRSIDVRGKLLGSQWKLTYRPPESARFEILASDGPWTPGSFVENHYSDVPGGTLIRSHLNLTVKGLPFFLPQKSVVRRVMTTIDNEDRAFLNG
jgi:hypothetical protein